MLSRYPSKQTQQKDSALPLLAFARAKAPGSNNTFVCRRIIILIGLLVDSKFKFSDRILSSLRSQNSVQAVQGY